MRSGFTRGELFIKNFTRAGGLSVAQFFVDGFSWQAWKPLPDGSRATRSEAIAELEKLFWPATNSKHYRKALAAMSVCDYAEVLRCCWAAEEHADKCRP